jgi:iron complex outermembrane receptor protein
VLNWIRRSLCVLVLIASIAGVASAQQTLTISGSVTTRIDDLAVPGAVVSVVGTNVTTTTDADGKYSLQVPLMSRGDRLQLRVDGLGLPPKFVDIATDSETVTADVALTLAFSQEITVGSRVAGDESEKAVPVDIITQSRIVATGYTETAQVIAALAPSLNFPRPTITDGTDTVRPATLRGLGPDQVLVLINGKRRHQSALVHLNNSIGRGSTGVDLNAIPLAAIDHIEILRDGAAAQYGSDAIAGVINVVLAGGVARPSVNANVGMSTGSFAGNRCTRDGLSCAVGDDIDFSDGELGDVAGSWGIGAGKGSVTVAAEYRHHNRTNRASFDPRDQIVAGDGGANDVAQPNHRWGDPDTRDALTFVNASIPLDAMQTRFLYAFGGFSHRSANSAGFFRRALDARTWPQIYPVGFLPVIEPAVVDASATVGVQGARGRWTYDVSGQYGRNSFAFAVGDSLNVSLGPTSTKTTFDAGTLALNQFVANAGVSRTLGVKGFTGPLNLAFGTEYRHETYEIRAGEPDSYRDGGALNQFGSPGAIGAQVFPGFRPSNEVTASRDNLAAYIDLEGDLRKWLRLGAAARTEHYSDFGGTLDGKITARLQPVRAFIVRGSVSSGFRAPSLAQSFFSAAATNFLNPQNVFDVFPDRNSTVNSFNGIQTFPSPPFGMNGRTLYAKIGRVF